MGIPRIEASKGDFTLLILVKRILVLGRFGSLGALASFGMAPLPFTDGESSRMYRATMSYDLRSLRCRSSHFPLRMLPSRYTSFPLVKYSPAISASLFQATMLCHSFAAV